MQPRGRRRWDAIPDRKLSEYDELTQAIIGAAIRVHKALGPGLPEQVYQKALAVGFAGAGLQFEREKRVDVHYNDVLVGECYLDYLVEDGVVVELKALEQVSQVHLQQVITYITILGRELGLLLNFGSGILQPKRVIPPKAVQASQPYQQRVQAWKPVWTRQSRWVRE